MTKKYIYNLDIFNKEDDISYYLLGVFITDGCVYRNNPTTYACQLSSCDESWLNNIKNIIGTNLKLHKFRENYYGIRICQNNIAQWFINHGCLPKKTYNVEVPDIPDLYLKDFFRGCIDGDGSLGTYISNNIVKRVCSLISASKKFLLQLQSKLSALNIYGHIINRGKNSNIVNGKLIKATVDSYCLSFYGINCYKLLKLIYYDNHRLSLTRKYQLAKEIINYYDSLPNLDKRKKI